VQINPDRLEPAELSALRSLQRCVPAPPCESPVWERLGEHGFMLVKLGGLAGVVCAPHQLLTARGYAYRTE
jgi:hypothetical protein